MKKLKRAKKPKSKRPEKPFPFLSLPAELRDQIYELVLTETDGISLVAKFKGYRRTVGRSSFQDMEDGSWWHGRRRYTQRGGGQDASTEKNDAPRTTFVPALLAVNKQVYSEAINYLYNLPIVLEDTRAMHHFLAAIGSHRTRLTDLTVKGWGYGRSMRKASNFGALTLLVGNTTLKRLAFECSIGYRYNPKSLARQLYRNGCYFFEAFGAAHGRKDAILDILEVGDANIDDGWHLQWRRGVVNANAPVVEGAFMEQFQVEMRKLLGCGEKCPAKEVVA